MTEPLKNSAGERYRIEFRGRTAEGREPERVIEGLAALFKCEKRKIKVLFNGGTHVLKKHLEWGAALKYYNAFKNKGAICDIEVTMDPASFKSALVPSPSGHTPNLQPEKKKKIAPPPSPAIPREIHPEPLANKADDKNKQASAPKEKEEKELSSNDFPTFRFDLARVAPVLCHPSHKEEILDNEETVVGHIRSSGFAISRLGALFIAIIISIGIEIIVADLYARHIAADLYSHLIPFLVFLSGLILLPALARPLRNVVISPGWSGKKAELTCRQTSRFQYITSRFTVKNHSGAIVCEMSRNNVLHRHECRNAGGEIVFTAEEEPDVSDILLDTADQIREEVIDIKILQKMGSVMSNVLKKKRGRSTKGNGLKNETDKLASHIVKQPRSKSRKSKREYVIRNAGEKAIGHFSLDRICILTLYREKNRVDESEKGLLFSFCLLLAGL